MQLVRVYTITGEIHTVTGLHIGAGRDAIEIGGMDNPVIKHPHTGEPYIPGSSLKGKLRTLLEWALHKVNPDGKEWGNSPDMPPGDLQNDEILRIFGTTHNKWEGGPTRASFRDCHLTKACRELLDERGLQFTEEKSEVSIDRIRGKARDGGLRKTERVPAGMSFDLEIQFRIFDTGDGGNRDMECLNRLIEGLKLLERDALGGSGSRGYGKVKFKNLAVDGKSIQEKFDSIREILPERPTAIVPRPEHAEA
jgi:CRISPR-associated protein Csm3